MHVCACAHAQVLSEAEEPDADERNKVQIASEIAAEEAFLAQLNGSAAEKVMHEPTCACGVWLVACGLWHVACGVRRVACGMWRVACMQHVACACASSSSCACFCVPVHVCQASLSKLPSYSDYSGALYNHNGEVVPIATL